MAAFFGVSLFYLRGESNDRTRQETWMDGGFQDEEEPAPPAPAPQPVRAPTQMYSSCAQARAAGAAPLYEGDPGYNPRLDRDKDGVACE